MQGVFGLRLGEYTTVRPLYQPVTMMSAMHEMIQQMTILSERCKHEQGICIRKGLANAVSDASLALESMISL